MKLCYLLFTVLVVGCAASKNTSSPAPAISTSVPDKYETVTVTDARTLDGCGFLLIRKDASYLNPVNLPDSLHQQGNIISIKFHPLPGRMSICMSGTVIFLEDVKIDSK
jgi:hypothetical protein